jgi:TPR repeat protein
VLEIDEIESQLAIVADYIKKQSLFEVPYCYEHGRDGLAKDEREAARL